MTAIPAGTRVKTEDGKYFNTLDYAEIAAGDLYADVVVQAEEAGAAAPACWPGPSKSWWTPSPTSQA